MRDKAGGATVLTASTMKPVAMETHHLQAGLLLIRSFICVTRAVPIRALGMCCEHVCVGVCSTRHKKSIRLQLLWSGLTLQTNRMDSPTKSTHCFTCQDVSPPSLGDNETTKTIFVLPLAAKLRGDALWFGLGLHSQPIRLAVSKRMEHVNLFQYTERLRRSFTCTFHCVR